MAEEPNKKPAAMQANATVRYVDRPECTEIFADSIIASVSTARRCAWSSASPPRRDQAECSHHGPALSGVPAGALRQRAVELINRMQQIAALLTQAGAANVN